MNHPEKALFGNTKPLPILPTCEHIAGREKIIRKSFEIQNAKGPVFDITLDCEDGAEKGEEKEHSILLSKLLNSSENQFAMTGLRIHEYQSRFWKQDLEIVLREAGDKIRYITIPKTECLNELNEIIDVVAEISQEAGLSESPPLHILIETYAALNQIDQIAAIPLVQTLDFGLLDFIAEHRGAISVDAMKSPGQFEHELIRNAKIKIASAALSQGKIPSHNISLDLKNYQQTFDDAKRAREQFGFLRMWSIYPTQIDAILDAMQADFSNLAKGVRVLSAGQKANWGPIKIDNELHDCASFRSFWLQLQQAKLVGLELPQEAIELWF